jgi:hypothetical protein
VQGHKGSTDGDVVMLIAVHPVSTKVSRDGEQHIAIIMNAVISSLESKDWPVLYMQYTLNFSTSYSSS